LQVAAPKHAIRQVGPIERSDQHRRLPQAQLRDDVRLTRSVAVAVNAWNDTSGNPRAVVPAAGTRAGSRGPTG
jgi:hypothetical protein